MCHVRACACNAFDVAFACVLIICVCLCVCSVAKLRTATKSPEHVMKDA